MFAGSEALAKLINMTGPSAEQSLHLVFGARREPSVAAYANSFKVYLDAWARDQNRGLHLQKAVLFEVCACGRSDARSGSQTLQARSILNVGLLRVVPLRTQANRALYLDALDVARGARVDF